MTTGVTSREREPLFNGAYVPTGAAGMVRLSVRKSDAGAVILEITNVRILDELRPEVRSPAITALVAWINRTLGALELRGAVELQFEDDLRTAGLRSASVSAIRSAMISPTSS